MYPVPKSESRRIITFSNEDDVISFRHHTYFKNDVGEIELDEIGPRFEMRRMFSFLTIDGNIFSFFGKKDYSMVHH